MLKQDPASYCLRLLTKFENEFGVDSYVDYITIMPYHWFGIYTGAYVTDKNGNNIVYVPYTKDKQLLRELLVHEVGHGIFNSMHGKLPVYLSKFLNPIRDDDYLTYNYRILTKTKGERPVGMVSPYCLVNYEEDFCETFSCYINYRDKNRFTFSGHNIDLNLDNELNSKLKAMKRFLYSLKWHQGRI